MLHIIMSASNTIISFKSAVATLNKFYETDEANAIIRMLFEEVLMEKYNPVIWNTKTLTDAELEKIESVVTRLKLYEPLQYILGYTSFMGLKFELNRHTLVPRPETEELVKNILQLNSLNHPVILDIGTGSGCIAISLKNKLPNAKVYATDISLEALQIAETNAKNNQVTIQFMQHDILKQDPAIKNVNILVSNPPYITTQEKSSLSQNVVSFEPEKALFVTNNDPLQFYKKLAKTGNKLLIPGGMIALEINQLYSSEVITLLESENYKQVICKNDLNANPRMVFGFKALEG